MILLDTNICIHVINARPQAVLERFRQYRMGEIGVCSVDAAELAYGVAKSGSERNRRALEMFLAPLAILPFDFVVDVSKHLVTIIRVADRREVLAITVPHHRLNLWLFMKNPIRDPDAAAGCK